MRFLNGLARFAAGDFHGCLAELTRSLDLDPASDRTRCALVYLYALTRDHRKVLDMAGATANLAAVNKYWPIGTYLAFAIFQAKAVLGDGGGLGIPPNQEALAAWLPGVTEVLACTRHPSGEVVFVFSDSAYFRLHTVPLILSLVDRGCEQTVHAHIVNPDAETLELASALHRLLEGRLRLTAEQVEEEKYCGRRVYYSCVRYCRLYQFFAAGTEDYLIVDSDMLINRAFTFDDVRTAAGASCVLTAATAEPMWNYFLAGFGLYTKTDAASSRVLGAVAAFVMEQIRSNRGVWFLDQIALFMAALAAPAAWGSLPPDRVYDMSHGPDSLVWAVTNDKTAPRFVQEQHRLVGKYLA